MFECFGRLELFVDLSLEVKVHTDIVKSVDDAGLLRVVFFQVERVLEGRVQLLEVLLLAQLGKDVFRDEDLVPDFPVFQHGVFQRDNCALGGLFLVQFILQITQFDSQVTNVQFFVFIFKQTILYLEPPKGSR